MSRWFGKVGYVMTIETAPGVYLPNQVVEREYSGDVIKMSTDWQSPATLNDNLNLNKTISIIADPFSYENFANIRYVEYMGVKWKVKTAEPMYPRIQLSIGGVYV